MEISHVNTLPVILAKAGIKAIAHRNISPNNIKLEIGTARKFVIKK
jgi:hypothetical protein